MIYEVFATNKTGLISVCKSYKSPAAAFKFAYSLKRRYFDICVVCEENNIVYIINGEAFENTGRVFRFESTETDRVSYSFKHMKIMDYKGGVTRG